MLLVLAGVDGSLNVIEFSASEAWRCWWCRWQSERDIILSLQRLVVLAWRNRYLSCTTIVLYCVDLSCTTICIVLFLPNPRPEWFFSSLPRLRAPISPEGNSRTNQYKQCIQYSSVTPYYRIKFNTIRGFSFVFIAWRYAQFKLTAGGGGAQLG